MIRLSYKCLTSMIFEVHGAIHSIIPYNIDMSMQFSIYSEISIWFHNYQAKKTWSGETIPCISVSRLRCQCESVFCMDILLQFLECVVASRVQPLLEVVWVVAGHHCGQFISGNSRFIAWKLKFHVWAWPSAADGWLSCYKQFVVIWLFFIKYVYLTGINVPISLLFRL